ncbi:hypothetical protein F5879DRAFT_494708 [Lentinula edodes]|nr:hypothetical protein F5879DRAFT_494708 [Lentinula edodes]
MDAQSHRIPRHETWILRFLIAVLASASLVTTCCASPLPLNTLCYSKHGSGTAGTNSAPQVPSHSHEEDSENFTRLGFRGLGLGLKKLSLAWDGMSLIGFAYTEALIGKEYENKPIRLSSLTLPARRPTHPSIEYLYLLPKLGLESQNPKDACWSCPVYASKSMMKANMPQMVSETYRSQGHCGSSFLHRSTKLTANLLYTQQHQRSSLTPQPLPTPQPMVLIHLPCPNATQTGIKSSFSKSMIMS